MKEKLLNLVNACIRDASMYKNTYEGESKQYRGITERAENPRTAYVSRVLYKGEDVYSNKNYKVDIKPFHTQDDGYSITIGFGKEPQIVIRPILKGNRATLETTTHKVSGTRTTFFNGKKPTEFDVVVVNEPQHYELRCGSFAYIIPDSIVKDFYDRIIQKRKDLAKEAEEKEINARLAQYRKS